MRYHIVSGLLILGGGGGVTVLYNCFLDRNHVYLPKLVLAAVRIRQVSIKNKSAKRKLVKKKS